MRQPFELVEREDQAALRRQLLKSGHKPRQLLLRAVGIVGGRLAGHRLAPKLGLRRVHPVPVAHPAAMAFALKIPGKIEGHFIEIGGGFADLRVGRPLQAEIEILNEVLRVLLIAEPRPEHPCQRAPIGEIAVEKNFPLPVPAASPAYGRARIGGVAPARQAGTNLIGWPPLGGVLPGLTIPSESDMLPQISAKFDVKRVLCMAKVIALTLFAGYAATKSEWRMIKDSVFDKFGQYNWYYEF